jgi:hypothetical protein
MKKAKNLSKKEMAKMMEAEKKEQDAGNPFPEMQETPVPEIVQEEELIIPTAKTENPEKISFTDLEVKPIKEEPQIEEGVAFIQAEDDKTKGNKIAILTGEATFEGLIDQQKQDIKKAKLKVKKQEEAIERVEEATKSVGEVGGIIFTQKDVTEIIEKAGKQIGVKSKKKKIQPEIPEIPEIPTIKQDANLREQTTEMDEIFGDKICPLCKSELIIDTKVRQDGMGLTAIITKVCPRRRFFSKIFRKYCDFRKKEIVKIE